MRILRLFIKMFTRVATNLSVGPKYFYECHSYVMYSYEVLRECAPISFNLTVVFKTPAFESALLKTTLIDLIATCRG